MKRKAIAGIAIVGGVLFLAVLSEPNARRPPVAATPAGGAAGQFQSSPRGNGAEPPSASSAESSESSSIGGAPVAPIRSFGGYECIGDCSGHEAGYDWAGEHDIDDEDACDTAGENSNSPSFAEGCKAYVNADRQEDDDDRSQDQNADQGSESNDP